MKSPMLRNVGYSAEEQTLYSDLQVLQSSAGYYVGTLYKDPDLDGAEVPGTRDSFAYYRTRGQAIDALALIERGRLETRLTP